MEYFSDLKKELELYLEPEQIEQIYQSYLLARDAHKGQKRHSGEEYITHPVEAAKILARMRMDFQSIVATLLHDVLEDTEISKDHLLQTFGQEIADLVDGVSKLKQIQFNTRAEAQAENFRKMILAMVQDIRVILVKLADRLHNMRTLESLPYKRRYRIAIETLEIYAPIANRLGMHQFYIELEDLCLKALYPLRYRVLEEARRKAYGHKKEMMETIERNIKNALDHNEIKNYKIYCREKHLFSIYKKMQTKKIPFTEIMDLYGLRILVNDIDTCYRTLGIIHSVYKPVPERFKDYIAIPKTNSYQSLHTTLFGPFGVPLEVQIRTESMNRVAENGIAAHWIYKSAGLDTEEAQQLAQEWVKGLLEIQYNAGNSLEFIESVKIDLFPDEVYVFTPIGEIKKLPKGSTPVDFAYSVHSEVGNTCISARLNRHYVPLSTPLSNGQTVEIITAPDASPNPIWLNFVVTGKARSNIRHFLKCQQEKESVALGKRLLEQSLMSCASSANSISKDDLKRVVKDLNFKSSNELYEAIGLGNQLSLVVAKRLLNQFDGIEYPQLEALSSKLPLSIKGTEGMVVHFSECCRPIPGDVIVGYLDPGKGIKVHVENCKQVIENEPDKYVFMRWEEDVSGEFKVDLVLEVMNERRVLALLAGSIADAESNIDHITVEPKDDGYHVVNITISVKNRIHLARIMRRLRNYKFVTRLMRNK